MLFLGLCSVVVFALSFLFVPNFSKFVYSQLAAVIGIDINEVRRWQLQKGLHKDLTMGDRGGCSFTTGGIEQDFI